MYAANQSEIKMVGDALPAAFGGSMMGCGGSMARWCDVAMVWWCGGAAVRR